jgi:transcriptional regulator with XRE-family HTH domain
VHLTLRTLREAAGKTQIDIATASQINQADVSRLESREDFEDYQVSTLRRYLAALGGQLEIVGTFGSKRIVITGVRAEPAARKARRSKSTRAKPARG